jgi:serine/threonine protein phosphatase PrpC
MLIRTAALTDIGKVREENEDRYLCDDGLRLYAVADGIGGLAGGGQAAAETVEQLSALARTQSVDGDWDFQALIQTINQRVFALGKAIDATFGIGTTLIVVRLAGQRLHLAHVGDSSCFLMRDGVLQKLTVDHTVENEMRARHGHSAAVFLNPRTRNALTRCVGQPNGPEVDVFLRQLRAGDRILLCTDGVSRFMQERELSDFVAKAAAPEDALKKIIALASDRGGIDNATGVLIFVDSI